MRPSPSLTKGESLPFCEGNISFEYIHMVVHTCQFTPDRLSPPSSTLPPKDWSLHKAHDKRDRCQGSLQQGDMDDDKVVNMYQSIHTPNYPLIVLNNHVF